MKFPLLGASGGVACVVPAQGGERDHTIRPKRVTLLACIALDPAVKLR